jgi:DNA-binding transcriptional MerR regulator
MTAPGKKLNSLEVCLLADITYRQLDHWIHRHGIVTAEVQSPGSGTARRFTDDEVKRIVLMGRLVAAGIRPAQASALVRRGEYDEYNIFTVALTGKVYVEVYP